MIQLDNTFQVPLPIDETWQLLTDLPRVAQCLPGAHVDEVVDGEYRGGLSTKIGPITAQYQGTATFIEHDEVAKRAVISARGREKKGSGSAAATVTAQLTHAGTGATRVSVSTSLAISGRAAQFGRSLLAEVTTTVLEEFVRRLEAMIGNGTVHPTSPAAAEPACANTLPAATPVAGTDAAGSLDLGTSVLVPMLRRAAVPLAAALAAGVLGLLVGRRRGGRSGSPTINLVLTDPDGFSGETLRWLTAPRN